MGEETRVPGRGSRELWLSLGKRTLSGKQPGLQGTRMRLGPGRWFTGGLSLRFSHLGVVRPEEAAAQELGGILGL